ncbi:MAG: phenylalanine--tRNA ligase subunit alpha [Methylacidiphilales bacterium]|nr:phenylalanine--tRNA ligase subunit alpha [Candidatus Methylacidiphilales bacterium]
MSENEKIKLKFQRQLELVKNKKDLELLRASYLGKEGILSISFKEINSIEQSAKIKRAKELNILKQLIIDACELHLKHLQQTQLSEILERECLDVSLPELPISHGSFHPITITCHEIFHYFTSIGFDLVDGPEIETDENNFTALNIPLHHPARGMHDTFFISNDYLLRTHTTTMEIHAIRKSNPPLQIITFGKVFRRDLDPTHTPMFHQFEGMRIDSRANFSGLLGVLLEFLQYFFNNTNLITRVRPSYFPFTEPSAEVDISCSNCNQKGCQLCKQTGWVEVLGCGMLHPSLFLKLDKKWKKQQGYAFGMGIERLAMVKYKLNDLRDLYNSDFDVLSQFNKWHYET